MKVLLTGGGTAGHITPNLALYHQLTKLNSSIHVYYIGEHRGMEQDLVTQAHVPFYGISAGKLRRYFSLRNIIDLFRIPAGIFQSWFLLKKIKPDVVFSKGGYVVVPVCIAAWLQRIPLIIHESDVKPGLATRLTAPLASKICTSWKQTKDVMKQQHKIVHTGIPVREEFYNKPSTDIRARFKIPKDSLPLLVVSGGSQGAEAINTFVTSHLEQLLQHMHVLHVTGKGKDHPVTYQPSTGTYRSIPFISDHYADVITTANIHISRAGSTAIAEFIAAAKPAILIPLPSNSSRGDQFDNAKRAEDDYPNLFKTIEQNALEIGEVITTLQTLLSNQQEQHKMLHASSAVASLIQETAKLQ